tara:strand:+ start:308 stop:712 length:405 start_codon:yes stop_codon:yes gene_type:complete
MKKRLTDRKIAAIVETIDGWQGKLTWDQLTDFLEPRFGRYTRQALHSHVRIKLAFDQRKRALREQQVAHIDDKPIELQKALQKIARLEAKACRLEYENSLLLEQFVRWSYNATAYGVSITKLDMPLPNIDREKT